MVDLGYFSLVLAFLIGSYAIVALVVGAQHRNPIFVIAAIISGLGILIRTGICRSRECQQDGQRQKPASENCFHRFCLVSVTSMTAAGRRVKVAALNRRNPRTRPRLTALGVF